MARILIVDDEPLIAAMMEEWLAEQGHVAVGPAHNLARALELAESDLDAAIVDVSLGNDNCYLLLEVLTARGLPFALATGYGEEGIEPRYRTESTLRKPFEFATFRRTIDQLTAQNGVGPGAANAPSPGPIQRPVNRLQRLRPWAQFRSESSLSGRRSHRVAGQSEAQRRGALHDQFVHGAGADDLYSVDEVLICITARFDARRQAQIVPSRRKKSATSDANGSSGGTWVTSIARLRTRSTAALVRNA